MPSNEYSYFIMMMSIYQIEDALDNESRRKLFWQQASIWVNLNKIIQH